MRFAVLKLPVLRGALSSRAAERMPFESCTATVATVQGSAISSGLSGNVGGGIAEWIAADSGLGSSSST